MSWCRSGCDSCIFSCQIVCKSQYVLCLASFTSLHYSTFQELLTLFYLYPPTQRSWTGVYWFQLIHLSVRPSIYLSVCGQNLVRSVSSTILARSISYLHILSTNFRRCAAWNFFFFFFKIQKFCTFGKFFKFVNLTLSCFDLESNMTQWYG